MLTIQQIRANAMQQMNPGICAICNVALNGEPGNRTWLACDQDERSQVLKACKGNLVDWTWDRQAAIEYLTRHL